MGVGEAWGVERVGVIIGLEGSYSEWSESEAAGGVAGRASS